MRLKTKLSVLTALLLAATPALVRAQAAAAAPGALPVDKFVDETTLLVADVDLTAIDVDALCGWVVALLKTGGFPQQELADLDRQMKEGPGKLGQFLNDFRKAGGRRAFIIVSANQGGPVCAAIPIGPGADSAAMTKLLTSGHLLPANAAEQTASEVVAGHLLFGMKSAVTAAKEAAADPKRTPRPDLAAAYAAGAKGTHRLAFSLPQQMKSGLIIQQPKLPPELGGGATGPVMDAFKFASLTLETPTAASPKASAKLVIQAADASGAKRLRAVVDAAIVTAKKEVPPEAAEQVQSLLALATPEVAGDTLTLDIDQAKFDKAAKPIVSGLLAAREQATRMQSMSNMRQILQGCLLYADENKNTLPAKLDDIVKYLGENNPGLAKSLMTSPTTGKPYVYIRPADKFSQIKNSSETVMLHDAYDAWPTRGIGIGFADGHVEWVAKEAEFKKLLANGK